MDAVETIQVGKFTVNIYPDESGGDWLDPRGCDNLTKMIFFHDRYNLGDKHDYKTENYSGWDDLERQLIKDFRPVTIHVVRMYDHSGIGISLSAGNYPYNCPWDSMWIGFVLVSREDALREFSSKIVTKKIAALCEKALEAEVATYHSYISGDIYGYVIEDENGDEVESCWGYIGDYDYCISEAKSVAESLESGRVRKAAHVGTYPLVVVPA